MVCELLFLSSVGGYMKLGFGFVLAERPANLIPVSHPCRPTLPLNTSFQGPGLIHLELSA